jgi:hypothetical protein
MLEVPTHKGSCTYEAVSWPAIGRWIYSRDVASPGYMHGLPRGGIVKQGALEFRCLARQRDLQGLLRPPALGIRLSRRSRRVDPLIDRCCRLARAYALSRPVFSNSSSAAHASPSAWHRACRQRSLQGLSADGSDGISSTGTLRREFVSPDSMLASGSWVGRPGNVAHATDHSKGLLRSLCGLNAHSDEPRRDRTNPFTPTTDFPTLFPLEEALGAIFKPCWV